MHTAMLPCGAMRRAMRAVPCELYQLFLQQWNWCGNNVLDCSINITGIKVTVSVSITTAVATNVVNEVKVWIWWFHVITWCQIPYAFVTTGNGCNLTRLKDPTLVIIHYSEILRPSNFRWKPPPLIAKFRLDSSTRQVHTFRPGVRRPTETGCFVVQVVVGVSPAVRSCPRTGTVLCRSGCCWFLSRSIRLLVWSANNQHLVCTLRLKLHWWLPPPLLLLLLVKFK